MAADASAFEVLVEAFETASTEYTRLHASPLPPPVYDPESEYITLESVEQFRAKLGAYKAAANALTLAGEELHAAKVALDTWFPAEVLAALDRGVALVAPAGDDMLVLVRHQDAYLIERGGTQAEALTKLERFLNQF